MGFNSGFKGLIYHSFFNFVLLPLISAFPFRSFVSLLIPPLVYILPFLISYVLSFRFPPSIPTSHLSQLKSVAAAERISTHCCKIPRISATAGGALCLQRCLLKLMTPHAGKPLPLTLYSFISSRKQARWKRHGKLFHKLEPTWVMIPHLACCRLTWTRMNGPNQRQGYTK